MSPPALQHICVGVGSAVMDTVEPVHTTIRKKSDTIVLDIDNVDQSKPNNGTDQTSGNKLINMEQVVQKARDAFNRGVTRPVEWRRQQLKNLLRLYEENTNAMVDALHKDLRRSKTEAILLEIDYLMNDIKHLIDNLDEYVKPEWPTKGLVNILDEVVIHKDPYGVALVIGAWNYPLQLLLLPMTGAIAAGNAVILKPSELSEACARFIVDTLPKYVDNDAIIVVEGGPAETTELLKQRFDYIFYTGGTQVGKIVYQAASNFLTPVTLELGGKSPVYIDNSADVEITVKRVLWGKFINMGQTCIAPDYILCSKEVQDKIIPIAKKILKEWYGEDPQKSPDLCRIVNSRHFTRLQALIDASKDKVAIGGDYDPKDKFIQPTVMTNVTASDKVMLDEIFGPILPIVPIENAYEAIKFINAREHPLVIYVFSTQQKIQKLFTEQTRAGGVHFNDTIMFYAVDSLPFGGVGSSGMGAYHGKSTFDTFTHQKSCLGRNFNALGEKLGSCRYPPYSDGKLNTIRSLMKKREAPSFAFVKYLLAFALGAGVSYGIFAWNKIASEDL